MVVVMRVQLEGITLDFGYRAAGNAFFYYFYSITVVDITVEIHLCSFIFILHTARHKPIISVCDILTYYCMTIRIHSNYVG